MTNATQRTTKAVKAGEAVQQGALPYTEGMRRDFQKKLQDHGCDALFKARRTLERRLQEHVVKLENIRKEGGHVSSVEREIRNFKSQIQAIDAVLK